MQPRVLVHGVDASAPREAARSGAATAFAALPPARTLLVGVVAWGDGPGLEPAPWTLEGVRAAARDAGLVLGWELLGPHVPTTTHRWLRAQTGSAEDRRSVSLEVPGTRRPRRIPRTWIGRHLCLVAPCVHLRRDRHRRSGAMLRRGADHWVGPMASAFEALARATGVSGDDARSEVGTKVAAQAFASTTVVLDASWWAPVRRSDTAAPHLVALDRCLVLGTTSPAESWASRGPGVLDRWLGARMGVTPASAHVLESPEWMGPAATTGWPRPPMSEQRVAKGIAHQALEALWRVSDLGRNRAAGLRLPPAVPGPLARHWHHFQDPTRAS